jgi:hypothetical protein
VLVFVFPGNHYLQEEKRSKQNGQIHVYGRIASQCFWRAYETLAHKPDHHCEQTNEQIAACAVQCDCSGTHSRRLRWTGTLQHRDDVESRQRDKKKTQGDAQACFHDEVVSFFKIDLVAAVPPGALLFFVETARKDRDQ